MKALRTCRNCGKQYEDDLEQCPHCGNENPAAGKKISRLGRIVFIVAAAGMVFFLAYRAFGLEDMLSGRDPEAALNDAQTVFIEDFDEMNVVNWTVYDVMSKEPVFGLMNTENGSITLPPVSGGVVYGLTAMPFEAPKGYDMLINRTAVLKNEAAYAGSLTVYAADKADYKEAIPVFSILYRTGGNHKDGAQDGFYICEYGPSDGKAVYLSETRIAPVTGKSFKESIRYSPEWGKLEWYIDGKGFGGDSKPCKKRYFFVQMSSECTKDHGEFAVDSFEADLLPRDAA